MPEYTGLFVAIENQVGRCVDTLHLERNFISMLMGLQTYYGVQTKVRKAGLDDAGRRIMLQYGRAKTSGAPYSVTDKNFEQQRLPMRRGTQIAAGSMLPSGYFGQETIEKYEVNRLKGDPKVQFVKRVAQGIVSEWMERLHADLFPSTTCAPTLTGGANGAWASDKITALAYWLQSGYSGNAATGSGTYKVLDLDLNNANYAGMKAFNVGTDSVAFGHCTAANLRSKLLRPARQYGGDFDLILMGSGAHEYLLNEPLAQTHTITVDKEIKWGGEFVTWPGIGRVALEYGIDSLPTGKKEIYALTSKEMFFDYDDMTVNWDDNPDGAPHLIRGQWYGEARFGFDNLRNQARAYACTDD